ncbi:ammonium transporter [Alicyclobacillus hesperidum URH17-3-68]|nr:ammonium transporter [Alicyclobacillus hesperidum URH17-3-68]
MTPSATFIAPYPIKKALASGDWRLPRAALAMLMTPVASRK